MDSLLIIGSGFVGSNLAIYAKGRYDIHITRHNSPVHEDIPGSISNLDITNAQQTHNLIKKIAPKIIIHTAAISTIALRISE